MVFHVKEIRTMSVIIYVFDSILFCLLADFLYVFIEIYSESINDTMNYMSFELVRFGIHIAT